MHAGFVPFGAQPGNGAPRREGTMMSVSLRLTTHHGAGWMRKKRIETQAISTIPLSFVAEIF